MLPTDPQTLLLTNLKRGSTTAGAAPHKPILLLAIMDGFEQGRVEGERIPIDAALEADFKKWWEQLTGTRYKDQIRKPIFYLKDGLGWTVVDAHDQDMRGKSPTALHKLLTIGWYGKLSPELTARLHDPHWRAYYRDVILEAYFGRPFDEQFTPPGGQVSEPNINYGIPTAQPTLDLVHRYRRDYRFRKGVMELYDHTCAISGLYTRPHFGVIEACHLEPYAQSQNDALTNGIALCVNLHRAFDSGYISISDDYRVLVKPRRELAEPEVPYSIRQYEGQSIRLPQDKAFYPDRDTLARHRIEWSF